MRSAVLAIATLALLAVARAAAPQNSVVVFNNQAQGRVREIGIQNQLSAKVGAGDHLPHACDAVSLTAPPHCPQGPLEPLLELPCPTGLRPDGSGAAPGDQHLVLGVRPGRAVWCGAFAGRPYPPLASPSPPPPALHCSKQPWYMQLPI